ncbi:MAG: prefoldin subunit alpha [Candidatus Geothermarchaeales archaeon]
MSREEIQGAIVEERRLARAMEGVYRELVALERTLSDRRAALSTISEDLKEPLKDKTTLVPIGGGVFMHASLTGVDEVLVNVGANIYLAKTKGEARGFIERAIESISKAYEERAKLFDELRRRHDEIYARLLEYQLKAEKKV